MNSNEKVIQYLTEAHGIERALTRTLQVHIAMTPRGSYRAELERHLSETRSHASSLEQRRRELDQRRSLVAIGVDAAQSLLGQVAALGKGPFDVIRGSGGEEKLLKNAKDESATEALEIATYRALEHFASRVGDEQTARLAASIREDEERMLAVLQERIDSLVDDVVRSELEGEPAYEVSKTGVAEGVRHAGERAEETATGVARKAGSQARTTARQARKLPGVAEAEGGMKGAVASEQDLAIANYDSLNVDQVLERLGELSQVDLAKVGAYERKHQNRSTVLSRIDSLREDEPWPGYDEQTVEEIRKTLARGDAQQSREVREYERRHKERQGVLQTTERALAGN
jgi:ferritin-like metal-binding protein YciE